MVARVQRLLCLLVLALGFAVIGATEPAAATYAYDAPTRVAATAQGVALASTTLTANLRANARGARPDLRTASGSSTSSVSPRRAAKSGTGAESSLQGALLREDLRLTEKYGSGGVRELENGRRRYYGDLRPARTPGAMAGQRTVREWDPATGAQRTWLETLDQTGRVRIVRPETGGPKTHYNFDEQGGFSGSR